MTAQGESPAAANANMMETLEVKQRIIALRAEGATDIQMLESLDLLPASALLIKLREVKPTMTYAAIYTRIKRGKLRADMVHGVWWIDKTSAEEWLAWLHRNADKKE